MGAYDPESVVAAFKVVLVILGVGGPVAGVWVWLDKRFDKKAEKHQVNNQFSEVKFEQGIQRQHIGKLFDKLEEHSRRDEELAREVLSTMASNHAEVLRELGRKADR